MKRFALVTALIALPVTLGAATADVAVAAEVANYSALWDLVKSALLPIVGFFLALALLKRGARRAS